MRYERSESYSCDDVPNIGSKVVGEMMDDLHHIRLTLVLNYRKQEVVEAKAEALKVPFPICEKAMEGVKKLEGLKVGPGISKTIAPILIGPNGCTHLGELFMGAIRAGIQGAGREIPDWMSREEYNSLWADWENLFKGRCIHFAQADYAEKAENTRKTIQQASNG